MLTIISRTPGPPVTPPSSASFPYGAAALPTGMTWNYTEGGTRTVTGSPLSFSFSSVPTVTGTTYDVTDAASWATAVAAAVDGDGIRITADFTVSTPLSLTRTTSSGGWVVVFTDRKATLDTNVPYSGNYLTCTSTNRIETTDTTCFRTITTSGANQPCLEAAQSSVGYWIVGVKFTASVNINECLVDTGANTMTQESHLPTRIVIDRCLVDGAEKAKRGVQMNGKDQLIVGSRIVNVTTTPQAASYSDSIGLWFGASAGKNLLGFNNYIEAESESVMCGGGAGASITNNVPGTDIALIRNHIAKNSGWDSDVTYALKKNLLEMKCGVRQFFFGNVMDRYRGGDQFHQCVFKCEQQGGDSPLSWWVNTDLTYVGNYHPNGTEGGPFNISPQGSTSIAHGEMARVTIAQNYFTHGGTDDNSRFQLLALGGAAPSQGKIDDLHIEHNTFSAANTLLFFDSGGATGTTSARFVYRNNACWTGPTYGPLFSGNGVNKNALDYHVGSTWVCAKNAVVNTGASWGAVNSLLVAPYNNIEDTAANLFTAPGSADYSAKAAGPLDNTATDGFDIGADTAWIISLTTGVV